MAPHALDEPDAASKAKEARRVSVFLIIFGVFWSAITVAFDVMAVKGLFQQYRASTVFQATPAKVISAGIKEHDGEDSTTYSPDITYTYEAGGTTHTSSRYSFGMNSGSHKSAKAVVKKYAIGSEITAYVDPADPASAVLQPQIRAGHIFMFLFLAPFNAVIVGGVAGVYSRLTRRILEAGDTLIDDDGRTARLRPDDPNALVAGAIFSGLVGFVLTFLLVLTGWNASVPIVLIAIGLTVVAGAWATHATISRRSRGDCDLVLDRSAKRLRLPARIARAAGGDDVRTDRVVSVNIESATTKGDDSNIVRHHVQLVIDGAPDGKPVTLATWNDGDRARAFAAWLNHELGTGEERRAG